MAIAGYLLLLCGVVFLIRGLLLILLPKKKMKKLLAWFNKMPAAKVRALGLLPAAVGVAAIYVAYIEFLSEGL